MSPTSRTSVALAVVAGAVLGFGALEAGILGIVMAIVVLVVLRSHPLQCGSYMVAFGLTGLILLGDAVLTCQPPSCHFDASTPIATAVDAVITAVGAAILGRAIWKARMT